VKEEIVKIRHSLVLTDSVRKPVFLEVLLVTSTQGSWATKDCNPP